MINDNLDKKINEFIQAMQRYEHKGYKRYEVLVSFLIVTFQALSLVNLLSSYQSLSPSTFLLVLITAYVATDLVNGLIHMFMDNNTHYTSIVGPYIAAFHLHHAKYSYKARPLCKVYFDESGTKFWLLLYLSVLLMIQLRFNLNTSLNIGLVAFGILSSIAELSHYYCHNATNEQRVITWLQNNHLLLSKAHHKQHHRSDNIQYAFLNGMTDPLINWVARHYYKGYKNHADQHTKAYMLTSQVMQ